MGPEARLRVCYRWEPDNGISRIGGFQRLGAIDDRGARRLVMVPGSRMVRLGTTENMARIFVFLGALNGFMAVALGAYASHGRLGGRLLEVFRVGVDYQALHALALLGVGLLMLRVPRARWGMLSGWLFLLGICLFSGSLYARVLIGSSGLVAITPFGGLTLLAGWFALAVSGLRDVPRAV